MGICSKASALAAVLNLAILSLAGSAAAQHLPDDKDTPDDKGTLSILLENDTFGSGTDRHFTHGTKVTYTTREYLPAEDEPIAIIARFIPFWPDAARARGTYSFGQNMYTPDDISDPNLRPGDRPYAGWLYGSAGLIAVTPNGERSDAMVLELGVVGPASQAEFVQTRWHDAFNLTTPRGWDNQLRNEPGIALIYEQQRKIWQNELALGLNADLVPNVGFALGNVATYLSTGMTIRLGDDLTTDLGPPRIRPSLPGSAYVRQVDGFNWYTFASVGARLVGRNIFLDGNTFQDSHSVDKKYLVGDVQAGFAMQVSDWRFTYTYVLRSKEFNGQDKYDKFGAISLSYRF